MSSFFSCAFLSNTVPKALSALLLHVKALDVLAANCSSGFEPARHYTVLFMAVSRLSLPEAKGCQTKHSHLESCLAFQWPPLFHHPVLQHVTSFHTPLHCSVYRQPHTESYACNENNFEMCMADRFPLCTFSG